MISVSARFLAALRESHSISTSARLYRPDKALVPIEVPVIGGSLAADADAQSRRQATLEVAFSLEAPLAVEVIRELPFGGYCSIQRGILYADGSSERVPLGFFRVDAVTWPELQGSATFTLSDRMAQVADEAFTTPWAPVGQKPSNAAVAAVQQVFGSSITYHVLTTPASEPAIATGAIYDEDRAGAISDLASSVGAEAFFDPWGDFVIRPRPPGTGTPVWSVDAGPRGVLEGAEEALDRSSVRNGVAYRAQGEPDTPPIYALAVDNDPSSPTRWGGPFGKVPLIVNSTSAATQAQANSAAASLLKLRLGLSRTLTLAGVPNPALEPGDLIEVVHGDGRTETQLINNLQLDFAPDGEFVLGTRANWRPSLSLRADRVRIWTGPRAWRELEEVAA